LRGSQPATGKAHRLDLTPVYPAEHRPGRDTQVIADTRDSQVAAHSTTISYSLGRSAALRASSGHLIVP